MNKSLQSGFYLCFLLIFATQISGQTKNQHNNDLKEFKWLEGNWKSDTNPENSIEEWHWVNDTLLQGISYSIKMSDTILNEKISIIKTDKGIFFIAEVANQNNGKAVYYKLVKVTDKRLFTFENLTHDFPKSINYMQINNKSLVAWVEGNGKRFEFKMKKIK